MSNITLPANVKQDPNTGLYVITSSSGRTFRVGADTQQQLDQYVNSVNTNTPTTVTIINPGTGDPGTQIFDPEQITKTTDAIRASNALLTRTKREVGVVGNLDGTYTNLRTNETLTKEQAEQRIAAAGLPAEAIGAITPKNSSTQAVATALVDYEVNRPSGIPLSPLPASTEPTPAVTLDNTSLALPPGTTVPAVVSRPGPAVVVNEPAAETARLFKSTGPAVGTAGPGKPDEPGQNRLGSTTIAIPTAVQAAIDEPEPFQPSPGPAVGTGGPGKPGEAILGGVQQARASNLQANNAVPFTQAPDFRVRVSLAPGATYMYKQPNLPRSHILYPLLDTNGVIYPYMPTIGTTYTANYDPVDVAHSNYKIHNYKNSSVENVSIAGIFTAQTVVEANYVLAVIHFYRSVTKMFYGKDDNPNKGTPPPLVYLSGLGAYNFDNHPMVVTSFILNYPSDVDYINAGATTGGINLAEYGRPTTLSQTRRSASGLEPGGGRSASRTISVANKDVITRVPTKISLTIQCTPIVTRNAISNKFSLAEYASGALMRGSINPGNGGGIW